MGEVKFSIRKIDILGFNYNNPIESYPTFDPQIFPLGVKYAINYRWKIDDNLFGVVIDIIYSLSDKKNSEVLKLKYIVEFNVEMLSEHFTARSNNDFDINELLESTLVGLTISTGRGILFEKTQGTFLASFILPPIDPREVILSKKFKEKTV